MKSEFILAFNEIAEVRKLPREVVMEALRAALVSAYRRNMGVGSQQYVEARIDEKSGEPTIWAEKEVVDEVHSELTEVTLEEAQQVEPNANYHDLVLVETTPKDFGRIAAQTAKQVILQRMREAERDAQYGEYLERVGDLVTGMVQSDNGDVVTISLGRAEAILPRSQQMPNERYRMHDKVRAYVMEVRKTNRGPQIIVSRTHRAVLRRLLEYEVPEIYNGTVEIKSIAREPGARSKVAVAALTPGADPVGACVGMRGVRIQSIVKELNGEKIDVIEWNGDPSIFISKALSPARVSLVFLEDDPEDGRTAVVVVPDDQLSLAIGREGQNARLAAKLTGWRIDIKSITEAAQEVHQVIQHEDYARELAESLPDMHERFVQVIEKKAANKPIMPEDFQLMVEFVRHVEGQRVASREEARGAKRLRLTAARERVPLPAYEFELSETDLPLSVFKVLSEAGYQTVGQVMEQFYLDQNAFLALSGFDERALIALEEMIETIRFPEKLEDAPAEELAAEEVGVSSPEEPAQVLEADTVQEAALEATADEPVSVEGAPEIEEWSEEDDLARARRVELVALMSEGLPTARAGKERTGKPLENGEDVAIGEAALADLDLLDDEDMEEVKKERAKQRRRELVFDEDLGRVVAKRRRKRGRGKDVATGDTAWGEFEE